MKTITLEKFLPERKPVPPLMYTYKDLDQQLALDYGVIGHNKCLDQCANVELFLNSDKIMEVLLDLEIEKDFESMSFKEIAEYIANHPEIICAAKTVDNPVKN